MNAVFIVLVTVSVVMICFISPESVISAMLDGGANAISLSVKLLAIYALWLSVLKMMENTGLNRKIAGLFAPVSRRLFKNESEEASGYIAVNLASNLLGMGGAATPAGIKAVNAMYKGSQTATKNMIMFLVVNATSIQLLPATVMSMMSAAGSQSPSSIIVPSLISTAVSTVFGVLMVSVIKDK